MADPAVPGATVATDTDYGLEAMDTAFIGRVIAMADRHADLQSNAQASVALGFVRSQALAEQWLGEFTSSMAGVKAASFSAIAASTADSILNYLILGGQVLGSPKPSLPGSAPYFPYGPSSGIPGGGSNGVDIGSALAAIAAKLTAIAAKVGA